MKKNLLRLLVLFLLPSCMGEGCKLFTDNVVCIGDSVTAGYDTTLSYVDYLKAMRHKEDFKNVSKAGARSSDGVTWFTKVIGKNPHTVIVMFGLNDLKGSRTVYRNNLITMTTEYYAMGYRVILCTPSPHMELNEKLSKYADVVRKVADAMGADVADVHANFPADWSLMSTVNHPNEKGHQLIAEVIDKVL